MRIAIVFLALGMFANANAAFITYTDRTSWEASLPGDATLLTEDFEGFTSDTDFRSGPVGIAGGTIVQTGDDGFFRNKIDVAPFDFTDNNGTNHASCFTNAPEMGLLGTSVEISMTLPTVAWGADFEGATSGEVLLLAVDSAGVEVATIVPVSSTDAFMGVVTTAGELITRIELRSQNLVPGSLGEGFSMDNIGAAVVHYAVPTLSSVSLLLLFALIGWFGFTRINGARVKAHKYG